MKNILMIIADFIINMTIMLIVGLITCYLVGLITDRDFLIGFYGGQATVWALYIKEKLKK